MTSPGTVILDVTVRDASGRPITGLEPWDFKLLDNGDERKILSFHRYEKGTIERDRPAKLILVVDTINLQPPQLAIIRQELEKFLRQNGGHLPLPTSIFVASKKGLRVQMQSSDDGHALLAVLKRQKIGIGVFNPAMGTLGALERVQLSIRQLMSIAENETKQPTRKLLVWLGPGWPLLDGKDIGLSSRDRKLYFDSIVQVSTRLRESRISLYCASLLEFEQITPVIQSFSFSTDTGQMMTVAKGGENPRRYEAFLKPVESADRAEPADLALKVLVQQSGGLIPEPSNDLAGQLQSCVADANAFYRLSFTPPPAEHEDEYHGIRIVIDKPNSSVRTYSGYYNQPPEQTIK